jgi:hypothetical protein
MIIFYEKENALNDILLLENELNNHKITEKEFESTKIEILNDV